jgi:DNA-binding response OmpR family regulator
MENPKNPLTREKLSEAIGFKKDSSNISFHIFKINSKAKSIGNRVLIKNIAKIGYFLNQKM